jgi:anti-sigma B factor antagonist
VAFAIDTAAVGGALVVAVTGDVDIATAPALRDELAAALAASRCVVLDLGGVGFMDSTGLGILASTHHRATAGGGTLVLARPQRIVRNALRLVQLDTLIDVRDSVDAAVAAAEGSGGRPRT